MTARITLATSLIPTRRRPSLDARVWSWICRRPTDALLIVFAVMLAGYWGVYLETGAWRMPTSDIRGER